LWSQCLAAFEDAGKEIVDAITRECPAGVG